MNQTLRDGLLGLVATLSVGCASEPLASDLVDDAGAGSPVPAEQAFPSAEAVESVASQIAGRNLGEHPPQIETINVTSVAGRDGNARLEVSFRETMPPRLKFLFGGQVRELQDDGQGPDSSAGDGI